MHMILASIAAAIKLLYPFYYLCILYIRVCLIMAGSESDIQA